MLDKLSMGMGLGLGSQAAAGGSPALPFEAWSNYFEITTDNTVVSEAVGVLAYDLSNAPAGIWSAVNIDGGDIRVSSAAGVEYAREIVGFNRADERGFVFFRATGLLTDADVTYRIYVGNANANEPAADAANGRESVWPSEFEGVWHLIDGFHDSTANGRDLTPVSRVGRFKELSFSPDVNSHQGVASDGTIAYVIDTDRLSKWNIAPWSQISENTDPIGDTGLPLVNHFSDGDYYDGKLYLPLEYWNGCEDHSDYHICLFDASDLSFISATEITEASPSSLCVRSDIGEIITSDFCMGDKLARFDLETFAFLGFINLSEPIVGAQGLTWDGSEYIISESSTQAIWRVRADGTVIGKIYQHETNTVEGVCMHNGDMLLLVDPGATERVYLMELQPDGYFDLEGYFKRTIGTLAEYFFECEWLYDTAVQMGVLSYSQEASAGSDYETMTLDDGDHLAIWDPINGWLDADPLTEPVISTYYRSGYSYAAAARRMVHEGQEVSAQVIASSPAVDTLYFGTGNKTGTAPFGGNMRFARIRSSYPSANALATEHANMSDPASFWTTSLIQANE